MHDYVQLARGAHSVAETEIGIKYAPEIYQQTIDSMEGIEGAQAIIEDIIIAGKMVEDHDKVLKQVLRRSTDGAGNKSCGDPLMELETNLEKCKLPPSSVKYAGHMITDDGA